MRRWIVLALIGTMQSVTATSAHAQFNVTPDLVEIQTQYRGLGPNGFRQYTVRVRNLEQDSPLGTLGIGRIDVTFRPPELQGNNCWGKCGMFNYAYRYDGAVDTRDFAEVTGFPVKHNQSEWKYGDYSAIDPDHVRTGPWAEQSMVFGISERTIGLIGCTIPIHKPSIFDPTEPQFPEGRIYSGRTCARDGFDGWLELDFLVYFYPIDLWDGAVGADTDLQVTARGAFFNERATIVPEPTTLGMLAVGLLGLGAAARRRRAGVGASKT